MPKKVLVPALRFTRLLLLGISAASLLGSQPARANVFADASLTGLTLSCPATINSGTVSGASTPAYACSAIASYSNGSAKVVRSASSWSSSNADLLSVSGVVVFNFAEGGYIAKGLLGSGVVAVDTPVDISASYSEGGISQSATASVTVKAQKLTALKTTCPATVYYGVPGNCTTTASYSDGFSRTVAPTWTSSNEAAATIDSTCNIDTYSLCSTVTAGNVSASTPVILTASYSENDVTKSVTTTVTVKQPPTLTDLVVNCPASVAADSGASGGTGIGSCSLVEFYSGTTQNVSQLATWNSTNPFVLNVANPSASGSSLSGGGKLTSYSAPVDTPVTISATISWYGVSKSAATTVLVKASLPVLTAIAVNCPSSVVAGASASCSAIAVYNNNSNKIINATWSSSNSAAAKMTGGSLKAGSVTADSPVTITASYSENGVSQSGTATVLIKSNLPAACTQSLPLASTIVPAGGGNYALEVASSSATCAWTASTSTPWLHLAGSGGSGNSSLAFSVDANSGASRSGSIVIGKLAYTVTQEASSAPAPITAAAIDCLFNWAEKTYPELFAPTPAQSTDADNYRFRFYSGTSAYLGAFNGQRLDYVGPQSNGTILQLGDLATWIKTAACQ
jgi:hypothetical protein